jgi:hypothetical protein
LVPKNASCSDDPYNSQKLSVEDLRASDTIKKPVQVKRIHFVEGNNESQAVMRNTILRGSMNGSQTILKSIMKTGSAHSLEPLKEEKVQRIDPPKIYQHQRYQDKHKQSAFSKKIRIIGSFTNGPGP